MKPLYLVLFAVTIFLFVSCKKESETDEHETLTIVPDSISYYDISPDTVITSIQYIAAWGGPVPSDSSCVLDFDVDNDSTIDFQLGIGHFYHWVTNSNPQSNYNYTMNIFSADSACSFTGTNYNGPFHQANFIAQGAPIDTSMSYYNGVCLFSNQPYLNGYGQYSVLGDNYVGFKFSKNNYFYFGWVKISIQDFKLTLSSWAINHTAGNSIFAGQTN